MIRGSNGTENAFQERRSKCTVSSPTDTGTVMFTTKQPRCKDGRTREPPLLHVHERRMRVANVLHLPSASLPLRSRVGMRTTDLGPAGLGRFPLGLQDCFLLRLASCQNLLELGLLLLLCLRFADLDRAHVTLALQSVGSDQSLDLGGLGVGLGTLLLGGDLTSDNKLADIVTEEGFTLSVLNVRKQRSKETYSLVKLKNLRMWLARLGPRRLG